ncbi:DDE-domain-containing protein, partial [Schizophyllum commune Loenen D]
RNWLPGFLRRNPEVLFRKASNLDPKRAQAFCQPIVHVHYLLLQEWMVLKGIPLENVYNMDEKGCQRGGGKKAALRKYLIPRGKKSQYRRSSENLELVTIIECVCADGSSIWPGFIFAGRKYNEDWFDGDVPPEVTISTTENGWTNDLVGLAWFRENFIPQATQRNTSGKPILLICDGHGSHTTLDFIELAIQNNIILYCLPPHTTHKLQPLDVGVFGPFQTEWVKACDASVETYNTEMPRGDFVHEYL